MALYHHFWGWVCDWIEENLAESLVPINPSHTSLFLSNHEAEDVVDRQVKPFRTRGLKESGWHLALFSKGANSVGRSDVSRLASDAQRSDKISQNVLWMYSTPCLFSPQKLVFADKYGVGPRWLPATQLKLLGTVSCEASTQENLWNTASFSWHQSLPPREPDYSRIRTRKGYQGTDEQSVLSSLRQVRRNCLVVLIIILSPQVLYQ